MKRMRPLFSEKQQVKVTRLKAYTLLDYIGKQDEASHQLSSGINITRGKVLGSILNSNNDYTADFINILLSPISINNDNIVVYRAIHITNLGKLHQKIQEQNQQFAFIPLDFEDNDWAALIIDKQNQLIFHFDPAKTLKSLVDQIKINEQQHLLQNTSFNKSLFQERFEFVQQELGALQKFLSYKKSPIMNPIDFVQGKFQNRGPYAIEIFKAFANAKRSISGSALPDADIPNSIPSKTILSSINCGAEIIKEIRKQHIEDAYEIIIPKPEVNLESCCLLELEENKNSLVILEDEGIQFDYLITLEPAVLNDLLQIENIHLLKILLEVGVLFEDLALLNQAALRKALQKAPSLKILADAGIESDILEYFLGLDLDPVVQEQLVQNADELRILVVEAGISFEFFVALKPAAQMKLFQKAPDTQILSEAGIEQCVLEEFLNTDIDREIQEELVEKADSLEALLEAGALLKNLVNLDIAVLIEMLPRPFSIQKLADADLLEDFFQLEPDLDLEITIEFLENPESLIILVNELDIPFEDLAKLELEELTEFLKNTNAVKKVLLEVRPPLKEFLKLELPRLQSLLQNAASLKKLVDGMGISFKFWDKISIEQAQYVLNLPVELEEAQIKIQEILKITETGRVLAQAHRTGISFFASLPPERLIDITAYTGNSNIIDEEDIKKVAYPAVMNNLKK